MQGWLTVGSQLFAWEEHEVVVVTIAVLTALGTVSLLTLPAVVVDTFS